MECSTLQGEEDDEGSYEYLVYQNVLIGIGSRFNLHPVIDYPEMDDLLEPAQKRKDGKPVVFRRFKPDIEGLHPSLQLASAVNCAFVFRKGKPPAGIKRKREGDDLKQSDEALKLAAAAHAAASRARQNAGCQPDTAAVQNGGVGVTQEARTGGSHIQGAVGSSCATASSLADEDDLLVAGGVQQNNDVERQQRAKAQPSTFKPVSYTHLTLPTNREE